MIWDVSLKKSYVSDKGSFNLDLTIHSNARRLVLFGPSGAGKSQTLKMISGLIRPDAGHVRLHDQTLFDHAAGIDLTPQQRHLAYVFQDYALFPHLTVIQNIAFALNRGLFNPSRRTRHPSVERWLDAFHLQAVAHQYPDQLSGGQRQRVALARGLVAQPRALLLDEPFAALDRSLRDRLRQELSALLEQVDIPLILITHDDEDVRVLAEEVLHVRNGHLLAQAVA